MVGGGWGGTVCLTPSIPLVYRGWWGLGWDSLPPSIPLVYRGWWGLGWDSLPPSITLVYRGWWGLGWDSLPPSITLVYRRVVVTWVYSTMVRMSAWNPAVGVFVGSNPLEDS